MKNYKDYDICRKALENEIILGNYNKKKSLKIVIYIFFLAIFNSYKIIDRKNMYTKECQRLIFPFIR